MSLEHLIRQYVHLGKRSPKGFEPCICQVCKDYQERGAFKFDGDAVGWNCFNCGSKFRYDPSIEARIGKHIRYVLSSFGIPEAELSKLSGQAFLNRGSAIKAEPVDPKWAPPKPIQEPIGCVSLDVEHDMVEVAKLYLASRKLDYRAHPYKVGITGRYEGRLIIPFFYHGKLVYYQARSLDDELFKPRYLNPSADGDKLLFNHEELYKDAGNLYVTEGAIDALSIGPAVALNGSSLSPWKLKELKKAELRGRKIIFVIDKNANGLKVGEAALKEGWYVTVIPGEAGDSNQALCKLGKLWLLGHLASSAVTGMAGHVLLKLNCR